MARFLSETLIRDQNEEEETIMHIADDMDESGKKLVRQLYEPLKITNEDLSRVYTSAEVNHLCLRTKVRVHMTLFNCVWDAKKRLDKKQRLVNRSERFVNAMLVKAVAKKMVYPYTSEEIAKCNYIRQCELKKENNRRLNVWHFECSQASMLERSSIDSFQPAQIPVENNDIPEMAAMEINFPTSITTQSTTPATENDTAEPEVWSTNETQLEASQNILTESLPDLDWEEAALNINTESITIESENMPQTESEPLSVESPAKSQPLVLSSENYLEFNTQVPAASTQTQGTEEFF